MFIEKVTALIGLVPVQFEPLVYVMGFILFCGSLMGSYGLQNIWSAEVGD